MSCTMRGKLRALSSFSEKERRSLELCNMHLLEGLEFSENEGFPILLPYRGDLNYEFHVYGSHTRLSGKGQCVHFFVNDTVFDKACDANLERTSYSLSKFDCLFTPDYSLYLDMPDALNKHNIWRSRLAGAFWQKNGFNVIPTASWASVDSFKYCFEGLPEHSVIGVSGVGVKWNPALRTLWQYALRTIEERLSPIQIVVYGSGVPVPNLKTPLFFIKDYISSHFRNARD